MKKLLLFSVLTLLIFTACEKADDFYPVTKLIRIQDTIKINKPFIFKLVLRNDNKDRIKLTIDNVVQKSLFFNLDFRCGKTMVNSNVENPKFYEKHDYKVHFLEFGDSIEYKLNAVLLSDTSDNLQLKIENYDRVYELRSPNCKRFKVNFYGMWNPGEPYFGDAMEGYGFGKEEIVIEK